MPYEEGAAIPAERWSAILTVITQTPRTEERLRKNPLGIAFGGLADGRSSSRSPTGALAGSNAFGQPVGNAVAGRLQSAHCCRNTGASNTEEASANASQALAA